MADLVGTLSNLGAIKDKALLAVKNANAPAGPGRAAGPLGKDAAGNPVRYSKTGEPPTPVTPQTPAMPVKMIDSKIRTLK